MKVRFKKLDPKAELPVRSTDGASGYDVKAIGEGRVVESGPDEDVYYFIEYRTGLAMELPKGYEAQIRPRSSISKTALALCNPPATIDSDYRGEIKVRFRIDPGILEQAIEQKKNPAVYHDGDRICQLVFQKVEHPKIEEAEDLNDTERGSGGFGSTGK
jgi:dUTP pyrophosphatase